jgi:hypothetical protein
VLSRSGMMLASVPTDCGASRERAALVETEDLGIAVFSLCDTAFIDIMERERRRSNTIWSC